MTDSTVELTDSSAVTEGRATETAHEARRTARPSIRPSAFGIPRSSVRSAHFGGAAADDALVGLESGHDPAAEPPAPGEPAPVPVSQTVRRKPPRARTAPVKADIEELLPLSQGVKSLPRPPRLPTFEAPLNPPPMTRRFPWMSLGIFAVMLAASLAPLARYRVERGSVVLMSADPASRDVDWSALGPLSHQLERTLWDEPLAVREALLDEAERALAEHDDAHAELAFTRTLVFDASDPRGPFGLARTRLAQGDLPGARGWAEIALHRRPQDAQYQSFLWQLSKPSARPRASH